MKTYENIVFDRDISLAIEHLFVGPYPTTFDPTGPITDILIPPAGFTWMGAVVEDSPSVTVSRTKYQLKTGVPKGLQFECVMEIAGKFECALYTRSNRRIQYALGGIAAQNILIPAGAMLCGSPFPSSVSPMGAAVTSTGLCTIGDYVVTGATSAAAMLSQNEAQIVGVTVPGAAIMTWQFGTPGFPVSPAVGQNFYKVSGIKAALGTNQLAKYAVLGVADFADGYQVIHRFDKMAPGSDWQEQIRPDDVNKTPISFDAYVTSSGEYTAQGFGTQLVVGHRYFFPKAQ